MNLSVHGWLLILEFIFNTVLPLLIYSLLNVASFAFSISLLTDMQFINEGVHKNDGVLCSACRGGGNETAGFGLLLLSP